MKESLKENLKPVIFIAIVLVLTAISAYPQRKFAGKVTEVVDGRTCVIELPSGKITAVLQYIEIPEPEQPLYQNVKDHLAKLVLGQSVEFLPRIVMKDRTAGQLLVRGTDVSQQMLRDGAAWYSIPEQSGQDQAESRVYLDNERQAKAEKRGVWSIEDLLPSWEYRADQAILQRRRNEEASRQAAFRREMESRKIKGAPQRRRAVTQTEMWANVGGASEFDQPLGFGDLRTGYDPQTRVGHVSTPSLYLDFPNSDFLSRVEARALYVYRGDKTKPENGLYVLAFMIGSKQNRFAKANSLLITTDGQKLSFGMTKRLSFPENSSVVELLIYRVSRAQLMKIAKAGRIGVQIGTHKGALSADSLMYINNLLNLY